MPRRSKACPFAGGSRSARGGLASVPGGVKTVQECQSQLATPAALPRRPRRAGARPARGHGAPPERSIPTRPGASSRSARSPASRRSASWRSGPARACGIASDRPDASVPVAPAHFAREPSVEARERPQQTGLVGQALPCPGPGNTTYSDSREVAHWQSMCRSPRAVGRRHVESANACTTLTVGSGNAGGGDGSADA